MGTLLKNTPLQKVLHILYYDPKSSVSFSGVNKLYQTVRKLKRFSKVKKRQIKDWLKEQKTYILHKPIRKRFQSRKTIVGGNDQQWQAD